MGASAASRRMPWMRVIGLLVLIIGPALAAGSLDEFTRGGLVMVGAAGVMGGIMGAAFGRPQTALLAPIAAWVAASLVHSPFPGVDPRLVSLGLAILAGVEAWRSGGRVFTVAIMSAALLSIATQAPAPWEPTTAAVFATAAAIGFGAIWASGGIGARAPRPVARREAIALALFLAIGLGVTITITRALNTPESIWLILMFVFRALVPPQAAYIIHLRFAVGAVIGAVLAGLLADFVLTPLGLAQNHAVTGAIMVVAIAVGLRFLPARSLVPPLAFSVAAIIIVGPSTTTALIRGEDALGIAALAIVLSFALDRALARQTDR